MGTNGLKAMHKKSRKTPKPREEDGTQKGRTERRKIVKQPQNGRQRAELTEGSIEH